MAFRHIQGNTLFHVIIFVVLPICALAEQHFDHTTPKPNFNIDCASNGLLLIKGDVISIAEVIETAECWSEASRINIFALNKVIFNGDIDKRDVLHVNIAIFAPTWEIIPPPPASSAVESQTQRQILLNADFEFNFYGVCIEKINNELLAFVIDGDKHRIKTMNDSNDRSIDEMSELKSTAIFVSNFNEVETLKAYRHYAWKNFGKSTNQLNFYKFFVELSNQYGLANLNELIDDFYYLEDKYSDLKKHIDVMPMYQSIRDQLEHPKQQLEGSKSLRNIFHAALLGKILAIRNHTMITEIDQLNGIKTLRTKLILEWNNDVKSAHSNILGSHTSSLKKTTEWANELIATNTALVDEIFNQTDRNEDDDDEIMRHQMELPLKSSQLVLSTIAKDSNSDLKNKTQSFLSKVSEKFQHRLELFKEVLQDFVDILNQQHLSDDFYDIQLTTGDLLDEVNELLAQSDQNRSDNLLNVLFNAWPNLSNVIDDTKLHFEKQMNQNRNYNVVTAIDQLNRMQSLMKCSQMGIETYRDCNNDHRKMMLFVQRYDSTFQKHRLLIDKGEEFEKGVSKVIVNLFEKSGTTHILPHLYELNRIFGQMQHHSLNYSSNIKRAIQDTNQAIKLTIDMYNANQAVKDRRKLLDNWKTLEKPESMFSRQPEPEKVDAETQSKIDTLKEIIKSNYMLEICLTATLQRLKMHVFPFDQHRFTLCDLPANTNATTNSKNVREIYLSSEKYREDDKKDYDEQHVKDTVIYPGAKSYTLYEWKYKDFKNEIHRLLSGESVIFNADIANSIFYDNAIKYRKIRLEFEFADEDNKKLFSKLAAGLWIGMAMMGNHYYRCDNRFYYVPGINVGEMFDYEVVGGVSTMLTSAINNNEPFLSPYTIWKFGLMNDYGIISSDEIKSFPTELIGEELNLKMIGDVDYVSFDFYEDLPMMCMNEELSKHYVLDRVDDGLPTRWSRENDTWYSVP